ncbi:MAG: metalloregulator ArsR/SmtB family transcription factor [Planctomycetes bacterium]|nr:metalloregulator ArsR/SmtB family transcription factor [Planctomycetota bacterium]
MSLEEEVALYKALSDTTRYRLLAFLAREGEVCVCAMGGALDVPDNKISKHLTVLRSAGMVVSRREGTWMYYRLIQPRSPAESSIHELLKSSMDWQQVISEDAKRMKEMCECDSK